MLRSWDVIYSDSSALCQTNCEQIHKLGPKKRSLVQFKSELPFFFIFFFFLNTKYFNTHGERESPNFLDCEGFFFFLLLIRKKERERNKTTREAHQFPKPLLQEQENEKVSKTLTLN